MSNKCEVCGERKGLAKSLQITLIRVCNERDELRKFVPEKNFLPEVIGGTTTYQVR